MRKRYTSVADIKGRVYRTTFPGLINYFIKKLNTWDKFINSIIQLFNPFCIISRIHKKNIQPSIHYR